MDSDDPAMALIDALNELAIPYMLVGSYSSNQYGIPRSTKDADVLVETSETKLSEFLGRIKGVYRLDPQAGFETVTGKQRFIFHHSSDFVIELFLMSDDPYDRARFDRRRQMRVHDHTVYYPTAEDVILNKLRWAASLRRPKDIEDVMNVIKVQSKTLDWAYIRHWAEHLKITPLLDVVRQKSGMQKLEEE